MTAFLFVQKKERMTDVVQKVRRFLALCQGLDAKNVVEGRNIHKETPSTYLQPFDHLVVANFVRNLLYSGRIDDLSVPRRFLLLWELHAC